MHHFQGYCRNFANRHPNLNVECEGPKAGCGGGSVCSANAVCEELPPGKISDHGDQQYSCKCKEGFNGNGVKCGSKYIYRGGLTHFLYDDLGKSNIKGKSRAPAPRGVLIYFSVRGRAAEQGIIFEILIPGQGIVVVKISSMTGSICNF